VRVAVQQALGCCGVRTDGVLSAIGTGLQDASDVVARAAVHALPWNDERARPLVPHLRALAESPQRETDLRALAVSCLNHLGPRDESMLRFLLSLVREAPDDVRQEAATGLGQFGPSGHAAVSALRDLFYHTTDYLVSYHAGAALRQVDPDGTVAIPLFVKVLKHRSVHPYFTVCFAIDGLEAYGPRARVAVPVLEAENAAPVDGYMSRLVTRALAAIRSSS
jgi:hypothetical protein